MRRWIGVGLVTALLAAAGCGGGGGGGSPGGGGGDTNPPPAGTTRVSGYVVDDPVAGATVQVLGAGGATLAQATTDAQGFYEAEVASAALAAGFRVMAAGGSVGGAPFAGQLTATYGPADDPEVAHATVFTTLVDRIAQRLGAGPGHAGRNQALAHLGAMGVLDDVDWSSLGPAAADLEAIRAAIGAQGLEAFLQGLVDDLADGDLSPERMPLFPGAHGGIFRVRLGDETNTLTALAGGVRVEAAAPEAPGAPGIPLSYAVLSGPPWLTVDGQGNLSAAAPAQAAGQSFPYVLQVTDPATGLGRRVEGSVFVAPAELVGEGTVGPLGGVVSDDWGDLAVEVPPGSVDGATAVRVYRARSASGDVTLEIETDRPVGELRVYLPNPDTYDANVPDAGTAPRRALREARTAALAPTSGGGRYPDVEWAGARRWFYSAPLPVLGRQRLSETSHREGARVLEWLAPAYPMHFQLQRAWELNGVVSPSDPSVSGAEPVLFVHGYTPRISGLGGGPGTWGNLPRLLDELGYLPFELRWRTDARFQDAAEDLRQAVNRIAAATGRKVHLVTHSFGGLVARTYLQGLADSGLSSYGTFVASVTTMGTPHSGIFDRATTRGGVSFPGGQDSGLFEACRQLSCYQAGEGILTATWVPGTKRTFLLESTPGEIPAALANLGAHPLPAGLPGQALVGLTLPSVFGSTPGVLRGGDGLITFHGQRLLPGLRDAALLTGGGALPGFRELVLGADGMTPVGAATSELFPGTEIAPIGVRLAVDCWTTLFCRVVEVPVFPPVYKHSGAILRLDAVPQAEVACTAHSSCDHDAYWEVRNFLSAHTSPGFGGAWITLAAQVVDGETGAPVAGAEVRIQAERMSLLQYGEARTDAQGRVSLTVPFYPATSYRALVFAQGYRAAAFDSGLVTGLTPDASPTSFGRLALQADELAYGSLGGVVTDAVTGARLAGAIYELQRVDAWDVPRTGVTGADGSYHQDGLLRGLYALRVEAAGYTPTLAYASVTAGQSNVAHATLRRALENGRERCFLFEFQGGRRRHDLLPLMGFVEEITWRYGKRATRGSRWQPS